MTKSEFANSLQPYLPNGALTKIVDLLYHKPISLKISRNRTTKYGDYRPPFGKHGHRISINGDLNPFAFLITLVHEYAHYLVNKQYPNTVNPHGKEWKFTFQQEMKPFLNNDIFPDNLLLIVQEHMKKPKASSASDHRLRKALMAYDKIERTLLEDLPELALFVITNKGVFRKGEKKRTRYLCQHVESKKWFMVNGLAEVEYLNA